MNKLIYKHVKVPMHIVINILKNHKIIPNDSHLNNVITYCYCEDGGYCNCFPNSLEFQWCVHEPNCCATCGRGGDEKCINTSTGKELSKWHKRRYYSENKK